MNFLSIIYLMLYLLIMNESIMPKRERVIILLRLVLSMVIAFFLFIIIGLLNIRSIIFLVGFVSIVSVALGGYIPKIIFVKSGKDQLIINELKFYSKKKCRLLAILGIISIIFSLILMVFGAYLMTYLWSLHN